METPTRPRGRPKKLAVDTPIQSRHQLPLTPPSDSNALDSQLQTGITTRKSKRKISLPLRKADIDEEADNAQQKHEEALSLLPGIGALILYHTWFVGGFSRLWIPVAATVPLLNLPPVKSTIKYWLWTMVLLFLYTTLAWSGCWIANRADLQTEFCSSVQHSSTGVPHTYTHSLFEDLVNASTRSTDIISHASELDVWFEKAPTLLRLRRLIDIQSNIWFLEPILWKTKMRWKNGAQFEQAHKDMLHQSVNARMKLLRLSQAYVTALDEAVRYTNEFLKQSIDPHAPDLLIWEEQVSGVYYPERVDKLKYLYRKYYVNMRGIIKSLLKTYGSVHESMDQIASQLLTIFDSADLNVGMSLYNSKRYRWQRSWRRLLPFTPYDDIAVIEEAQKAYRRINRICHKTLGLIERSEAELKCLLPQIAVSEAEINRTTNATMSVLEVQHMERNIRQMASKVKAALELRDRFQDAARGAELKFKRWERPTAYGEEAVW